MRTTGNRQSPLQISSRMAKRLPVLASHLGLNARELCQRHGLDESVLEDRTARVPLEPVLAV